MIPAHIIAAIRSGKLASITRTEWLEVADALEASAIAPLDLEPARRVAATIAAATSPAPFTPIELALMGLCSERWRASAGTEDERIWRCHYRAVARQCGHGKSLDGPCAECGDGVRK